MLPEPARPPTVPALRRAAFVAAGLACVGLGGLGIAIPGLPTTPFLLAAAYLFARNSPRLSAWLSGHRWLGPYLRAVRGEREMPVRAKAVTLGVLWPTIGVSLWLLSRGGHAGLGAGAALLALATAVTWFVGWRLPTVPGGAAPGPRRRAPGGRGRRGEKSHPCGAARCR